MSAHSVDAYVRAALSMQGYEFNETQILEIVAQFSRIEAIAKTFVDVSLPLDLEALPVFRL